MPRLALVAAAMLAGASAAAAQTDVPVGIKPDVSIAVVSDYRLRGLSQSDRDPAVQLTADLTHASGVYVGTFVSTIGRYAAGGADPEIDLYAGIRRTIAGTTLDGGLLYYVYPGAGGVDGDYAEPYVSVGRTLGPVTAKIGGNVAWKQRGLGLDRGDRRPGVYTYAAATAGLPGLPLGLAAHVGHSFEPTYATFDRRYTDWALTASYALKRVSLAVSYVDTDTSIASYPEGGRSRDIAGAGVLVSATLAVF